MGASLQPESVGLDELEARVASDAAAASRPDLNKIVLEGDSVPEEFRGKTAMELAGMAKALGESLRLSESARRQAETNAQLALNTPQKSVAPVPVREPELSDDQLAELHQQDPIKAIRYMQAQAKVEAERNMDARLTPLLSGASGSAEAQARAKYATEFELFGDQISKAVSSLPNASSVMTTPQAWDDMVAYVRGKSENFDKLVEHKAGLAAKGKRTVAQAAQIDDAGISMTSSVRAAAAAADAGDLDDLEKEIATKLGMSFADYKTWKRVS